MRICRTKRTSLSKYIIIQQFTVLSKTNPEFVENLLDRLPRVCRKNTLVCRNFPASAENTGKQHPRLSKKRPEPVEDYPISVESSPAFVEDFPAFVETCFCKHLILNWLRITTLPYIHLFIYSYSICFSFILFSYRLM